MMTFYLIILTNNNHYTAYLNITNKNLTVSTYLFRDQLPLIKLPQSFVVVLVTGKRCGHVKEMCLRKPAKIRSYAHEWSFL
jgi:hypothetical protein